MKWLNLLAIIPIIIGVLIFKNAVSGRKAPEKKTEPEAVLTVTTDTVRETALPRTLQAYGNVVTARRWTAVPQVSGKVTSVHPNLSTGGTVGRGQVLFAIETVDHELEQQRILAERQAMRTEIDQVQQRRTQLEQSREAALSTLRLLKKEEERYRKLFEQGATPASTVDAQTRAVLNQQRQIEEIESNLATLPAQVQGVQARMKSASASLQKQSVQIGRTVVTAPFDGRLGEVYVEPGQVVNAGSQLFTLQGTEQLRVEAKFPQSQLGEFPIKRAFITIPNGQRLPAEIGPLRESIDPATRTAAVQLTVPGLGDSLLPGDLVQVTLEGDPHPTYPVIPRSALHNGQVFLVEEGKLKRREVKVAFREGDMVAVEEGIGTGEQLVVSDPGLAIDGTPVKVTSQEK